MIVFSKIPLAPPCMSLCATGMLVGYPPTAENVYKLTVYKCEDDTNRLKIMSLYRKLFSLTLAQAKELIDSDRVVIGDYLDKYTANDICNQITQAGVLCEMEKYEVEGWPEPYLYEGKNE